MATFSITVTGAREIERKLAALPVKVAKKVVRKAVRAGAKVIHTKTKQLVPVDTGRLKRSLVVRAAKKKKRGEFSINVMPSAKKEPGLVTHTKDGKRYWYPAVVEFGTDTRKAQSFIRKAYDAKGEEAKRIIERELLNGIMKAVTSG